MGFDNTIKYENGVKIPFDEEKFRYAYPEDILLCIEGGSAGRKIAILSEKVCFGNKLCDFHQYLNQTRYLYYLLQSPYFFGIFKENISGIIGGVSVNKIKELIIPLPPLSEQRRIVAKIEELEPFIEEYGKAETELTALNTNFPEQIKKSILQYAIQGKLVEQDPNDEPASVLLEKIKAEKLELIKQGKIKKDKQESFIYKGADNRHYEKIGSETKDITDEIPFEIPNNWCWVRLKDIGNIISGGTPKTEVKENWENGTIPWLTPADMKNIKGKYVKHGEWFITEQGLNSSSAVLMPENSIVFSSRAPIGYIAITQNTLCTNQGFKSFVAFDSKLADYIYYVLIALTDNIIARSSGTTFKEISGSEFAKTLIPLPPISEQNRIVFKLKNVMQVIKTL